MAADTQVFFIVSSGRSGTAMLHKVLAAAGDIEMQHEYAVDIVQPLAVRRYLGLASAADTRAVLESTHKAAAYYSLAAHWGDSSNKLSWLIPELAEAMPQAKFVHLARDGRKVCGSYFRKLADECYDDRSTAILQAFADGAAPVPPPEKKYWWPVPRKSDPFAQRFAGFNRFERICWHWQEINRVILASLAALPEARKHFVRLEDLAASPQAAQGLFQFLNLPYRDAHFAMFARPHNVNRPQDALLDADQAKRFAVIASSMMDTLGYADREEYVVKY
jgi:Sulfotransferase family